MPESGKLSLFQGEERFLLVKQTWHGKMSGTVYCHSLYGEHSCTSLSLSDTFVINIFAVCFLISLLFPVNCTYLNLWSLPFVPPVEGGRATGACFFSGSTKLENPIPKSPHY